MAWVLLPAILKSHYDINEIITTLMMTWVAINLVNWLVKGPINDPTTVAVQTTLIPLSYRMPMIPFTRIHIGLITGIVTLLGMHWVIYEDQVGRSRALRYRDSDDFLFPMTMISRRREVGNLTPVVEIYDKARAIIAESRPPLPFQ